MSNLPSTPKRTIILVIILAVLLFLMLSLIILLASFPIVAGILVSH